MAYEFKKLSNVSAVDSVSDNTNVLIEENGTIKKVSKSAVGETAEKIIGKIAEVATINSTSDNTNVIIEENGEIKRVSKSAVGETAESVISKIAEVPSTTSVTDTTNVLIEEDGEIKRVAKNVIHGRELVYEFTPGIDADGNPVTDVDEFVINVDDDLSWMTSTTSAFNFEVEVTCYGNEKEEDTDHYPINTNVEAVLVGQYPDYNSDKKRSDKDEMVYMYVEGNYWMPSTKTSDSAPYFDLYILNKKHIDEDQNYIDIDHGGSFEMYASNYWPFKSIKIYKTTY